MKTTMTILVSILVSLANPALAAEPEVPSVDEIVNKANIMAYYQGQDGKSYVTMKITDKNDNVRAREFIILRKNEEKGGDQKYFVYFLQPPDVRKMVFMVQKHVDKDKDDDRWLYLPSLDLVNRIAASDKRTSFVGSDFLYEDVSGRGLDEDTHELIETTEDSFVVKNVPKEPETVEFAYFNVTIDRKTHMPMKMEYFDKENKLYRVIESKKIWLGALRIPLASLGPREPGARWRWNVYRIEGEAPNRTYMAWRPTGTERPSFHVPGAFGWLRLD